MIMRVLHNVQTRLKNGLETTLVVVDVLLVLQGLHVKHVDQHLHKVKRSQNY